MFGHKLVVVVVVEADQELGLELLPLTAEQSVLMLSAQPAGGIITSEAGQGPNWPNLRHFFKQPNHNLLHNLARLLLDLLAQVGLLSNVFSKSKMTDGREAVAAFSSSSDTYR